MLKRVVPIFLVLIVAAVFLGQIRQYPEYPGEEVRVHVNVVNDHNHREKSVRVGFWIPKLGIYETSDYFTIYKKEKTSRSIFADVGNARPGWYMARIWLTKGGRTVDSDYRYVLVV